MKILYVESDQKWSVPVIEWLSSQSYTVEAVGNGWDARERLSLKEYDLVIMDWDLPGISGLELCKRFRAAGRHSPVLVTAGSKLVGEQEEILGSGADDYLAKPFELQELSNRIKSIFKRAANREKAGGTACGSIGLVLADRYEIVSELGKGGMGNVFLAKHTTLDRLYAVKVLNAQQLSDPISIKRFEREAKAASLLSHGNLVSVYDFGVTASGQPFLVMDYLQGSGLDRVLADQGVLSGKRFVDIFSQICDGLTHAHGKGIIHRDLKPSNIMLLKDDNSQDVVKVFDFGIVKIVAPEGAVEKLTRPGEFFGSPLYMSPEQSQALELDGRSDIYSIGCIMYEALTGLKPFEGQTVLHTVLMHLNDKPKPLATVNPHLALPPAYEAVVFKAMEKNPADRHATMAELKADLQKLA
jgi:serine/threonine protein kinase